MAIIGAVDACAITKDGVSGQKKNRVTYETDRKWRRHIDKEERKECNNEIRKT